MTGLRLSKVLALAFALLGRISITLTLYWLLSAALASDLTTAFKLAPLAITPQEFSKLEMSGAPLVLIDADKYLDGGNLRPRRQGIQYVFFSHAPGFRVPMEMARRERGADPRPVEPHLASRYLTGTHLDWQFHGIKFERDSVLSGPVRLSAERLSNALRDESDMDIIDLRSPHHRETSPKIPGSRNLLPHQIETEDVGLDKRRWLVVVDGGDGIAAFIADRLYARGYTLIAVLDGGYPSWLSTAQR
jgi:rhodanese-related sulfurtransferase